MTEAVLMILLALATSVAMLEGVLLYRRWYADREERREEIIQEPDPEKRTKS